MESLDFLGELQPLRPPCIPSGCTLRASSRAYLITNDNRPFPIRLHGQVFVEILTGNVVAKSDSLGQAMQSLRIFWMRRRHVLCHHFPHDVREVCFACTTWGMNSVSFRTFPSLPSCSQKHFPASPTFCYSESLCAFAYPSRDFPENLLLRFL